MRRHSMPEMKEGGVNVTPLIDVVMCLIIFFMLVAKIGVKTGAAKMALPETIIGKKIDQLGDNIILNVTDPNIKREADGVTPQKDPTTGQILKLETVHSSEPHITAAFNENDKEPAEIQVRREVGGRASYPLRDALKTAVEARKKAGKLDSFSITIRAEKDLDFSMLQQVLIECANAGVKNLNYGSVSKKSKAAPQSR